MLSPRSRNDAGFSQLSIRDHAGCEAIIKGKWGWGNTGQREAEVLSQKAEPGRTLRNGCVYTPSS